MCGLVGDSLSCTRNAGVDAVAQSWAAWLVGTCWVLRAWLERDHLIETDITQDQVFWLDR